MFWPLQVNNDEEERKGPWRRSSGADPEFKVFTRCVRILDTLEYPQ